jgi:hypothetical protein
LPDSERILPTVKLLPLPREEPVRNKAAPVLVSGSSNIEQNHRLIPQTRVQRFKALWPWVWLVLAGVLLLTLAWAIALCWAAFAFVRWLVG